MSKSGGKNGRQRLVNQIDRLFSLYVRRFGADLDGNVECWTCDKCGHWRTMQCGHFQSRQYENGRWLLSNVAVQCGDCNGRSGEQYRFGLRLDAVHGAGTAARVEDIARRPMRHTLEQLEILKKHWADAVQQLDRRRTLKQHQHGNDSKARHKPQRQTKTNGTNSR